MPPSPCTGSTRNAAVLGVMAASSADGSLYGTATKPGGNAPKPSRYCASDEKPTMVIDRPRKLLRHTMTSARSAGTPLTLYAHLRTALSDVSTASAPPLEGMARGK